MVYFGLEGLRKALAAVPSSALGGLLYEAYPAAPFMLAIFLAFAAGTIIIFFVKEPEKKEF